MTLSVKPDLAISVVLATYERRYLLQRTLPTLLNQNYPPSAYEIVLVVDGSTDGTARYIRSLAPQCNMEVIEQARQGPAVARNSGIAAASGDVVLFVDDDIRCAEDVLREHAAAHSGGDASLRVHGAIYLAPESPRSLPAWCTYEWYSRYDAELRAATSRNPNWRPYLNVNASVRRDLLRELAGFDVAVPFPREDFELAFRMVQSGVSFAYRPRAIAYEVFMKSSAGYVHDGLGYGAAEVYISRKHRCYRPFSGLAPRDRDQPTPLRTAVRRSLPRLPPRSETLLTPAVHAAETLIRRPRARAAGTQLLEVQHRLVLLRGARRAVGSAAALEAEFDRWLAVLMYHYVGEKGQGLPWQITLRPHVFERQITWLARRGFTGVRPREWLDWLAGEGTLPRKAVLITFDDAYADIGTHALPVLQQHGFGALVFVVTGRIGGGNTWDSFPADCESPALMSVADVIAWAGRGIDFGAHGRTHRDLRSVSAEDLKSEILGSQEDLQRLLGTRVSYFAYPYGHYTARARELVTTTYDLAFTTTEGLNGLRTDPHMLRRTMPTPEDTSLHLECRARIGRVPLAQPRDLIQFRTRLRPLIHISRTMRRTYER